MDRVARIRCMLSAALPAGVVGKTLRFLLDGRAVIPDEPAERARLAATLLGRAGRVDRQDRRAAAQPRPVRADRRRRAGGRRGPGQARRARPRGRTTRRCARRVRPWESWGELAAALSRCGCSSRSSRPPTRWPSSPPRSRRCRRPRVCAGRGPSSGTSRWRSWPRSTTARARRARPAARAGGAPARPAHAGAGGRRPVRQQVLWTRVDGDRRRAAQARRRGAGRRAAVRAADRRAALPPHLTLARAGRPAPDLAPLAAALDGFAGAPWTASDLHLVRSVLGAGPGGTAHHETLASWPLTGDVRS